MSTLDIFFLTATAALHREAGGIGLTLEVEKGSRDFFKEAEWPRLDLSRQASKWGCFLTLCVSKHGDREDRSQLCGVRVAPLPVSPSQCWGLGLGGRRRLEGAELPPSGQGWRLPTGAACTAFLSVFRKKARKSQTGFPGLENPHLSVLSPT